MPYMSHGLPFGDLIITHSGCDESSGCHVLYPCDVIIIARPYPALASLWEGLHCLPVRRGYPTNAQLSQFCIYFLSNSCSVGKL